MSEIKLSVSKTKTFSSCKKQFHYSYILKLPKKDFEFHIFGKFIHKVLEDFHKFYLNEPLSPILFNVAMTNSFKAALKEFQINDEAKLQAKQLITEYLKKITEEKNKGILPIFLAVEKPFNLEITVGEKQIILNGFIDRVQIDDDGVLNVVDYKTSKTDKYLKNDWFQLLTYAYVLYNEDPSIKKIRGSYIMVKQNYKYLTKEFNIDDILDIKNKYIKYAEQIENEQSWLANPTPLCSYCTFLDICEEGKREYGVKTDFGEVKWV